MAEVYGEVENIFGVPAKDLNITITARLDTSSMTPRDWVSSEEKDKLIRTPNPLPKLPLNLSTAFRYSPLPEGKFRLLDIVGLGDFPWVEINDYPMDNAPKYNAISYAWGRETTSRAFMCNRDSFAVSAHVLDALNHLQPDQFSGKKVWIDAICINQEDDVEKAVQVAHMQSIYSSAEEVYIWLGRSEDESDLAIDQISSVIDYVLKVWQHFLQGTEKIPPPISSSDAVLAALGHLYVRPWFNRVWVVQELLLARSAVLVCGNRRIDWDTFAHMTVLLLRQSLIKFLASPTVPRMAIERSA